MQPRNPAEHPQTVEGRPDLFVCSYCAVDQYIRKADRRVCAECKGNVCTRHTFIRVDESNESITRNSPLFCRDCADRIENRRHQPPFVHRHDPGRTGNATHLACGDLLDLEATR